MASTRGEKTINEEAYFSWEQARVRREQEPGRGHRGEPRERRHRARHEKRRPRASQAAGRCHGRGACRRGTGPSRRRRESSPRHDAFPGRRRGRRNEAHSRCADGRGQQDARKRAACRQVRRRGRSGRQRGSWLLREGADDGTKEVRVEALANAETNRSEFKKELVGGWEVGGDNLKEPRRRRRRGWRRGRRSAGRGWAGARRGGLGRRDVEAKALSPVTKSLT